MEDRFQQLLERITKLEGQQEEMKLLQEKVKQSEDLNEKQNLEITELKHQLQPGIKSLTIITILEDIKGVLIVLFIGLCGR